MNVALFLYTTRDGCARDWCEMIANFNMKCHRETVWCGCWASFDVKRTCFFDVSLFHRLVEVSARVFLPIKLYAHFHLISFFIFFLSRGGTEAETSDTHCVRFLRANGSTFFWLCCGCGWCDMWPSGEFRQGINYDIIAQRIFMVTIN